MSNASGFWNNSELRSVFYRTAVVKFVRPLESVTEQDSLAESRERIIDS